MNDQPTLRIPAKAAPGTRTPIARWRSRRATAQPRRATGSSGAVHAPLRLGGGLRLAGLAGRGLLWLAGPGRLGGRFGLAGCGLLWLAGPGRLGGRFAHGPFLQQRVGRRPQVETTNEHCGQKWWNEQHDSDRRYYLLGRVQAARLPRAP